MAKARKFEKDGRDYVQVFRSVLPTVASADGEIFKKAANIIPPTPAVSQIVATASYRAWNLGRSLDGVEGSLALFARLDENSPKLEVLAKIAYATSIIEESRRDFSDWLLQPTTTVRNSDALPDLESNFDVATLDAQVFFLECMHA